MKKNLLYYVYPVKGKALDWNIGQIVKYWDAFDGAKIVQVAVDDNTLPTADVVSMIGKKDFLLMEVQNDKHLCQTSCFIEGLSKVTSDRHDEATFYAHAKGTSRGALFDTIRPWIECMYYMNLSNTDVIKRILFGKSSVGCLIQVGTFYGAPWHFSGAFFWLKHSGIFTRKWTDIYPNRYGVEMYPGRHIPVEEAFTLTPPIHHETLYCGSVRDSDYPSWHRDLVEKWAHLPIPDVHS